MSQYCWKSSPDDIRIQVIGFVTVLQKVLENNLTGVYLHGSLALGCFNPDRSDIDLLVVTGQGMTLDTKRAIAGEILNRSLCPAPIEISFLPKTYLSPWRYPTPYDLHYSEDWRKLFEKDLSSEEWEKWNDDIGTDKDLAAHITVTLERGICLFGECINEVFVPVPTEHYVDSIITDFEWGAERIGKYPESFVLNACRVYAFLAEGAVLSKDEGAEWGLRTFEEDLQKIISLALRKYRGDTRRGELEESHVQKFGVQLAVGINGILDNRHANMKIQLPPTWTTG